mgnify:CR=1 FL=1|jgi:hypothetical protein|tara:strand:- start:328 stop:729 length:402 start_codon:yes stop_codon:yes gene_type:complete
MNNIGLIFSRQNQEIQQYIISKILEKDINAMMFADRTLNVNSQNLTLMPIGNLLSFTGDLICVSPEDVNIARNVKRDINIKYILDKVYTEIQDWFHQDDDIEYLIYKDEKTSTDLAKSITGLQNIKTFDEYIL